MNEVAELNSHQLWPSLSLILLVQNCGSISVAHLQRFLIIIVDGHHELWPPYCSHINYIGLPWFLPSSKQCWSVCRGWRIARVYKGIESHGVVGDHVGNSLRAWSATDIQACVAIAAAVDRIKSSSAAWFCIQVALRQLYLSSLLSLFSINLNQLFSVNHFVRCVGLLWPLFFLIGHLLLIGIWQGFVGY